MKLTSYLSWAPWAYLVVELVRSAGRQDVLGYYHSEPSQLLYPLLVTLGASLVLGLYYLLSPVRQRVVLAAAAIVLAVVCTITAILMFFVPTSGIYLVSLSGAADGLRKFLFGATLVILVCLWGCAASHVKEAKRYRGWLKHPLRLNPVSQ